MEDGHSREKSEAARESQSVVPDNIPKRAPPSDWIHRLESDVIVFVNNNTQAVRIGLFAGVGVIGLVGLRAIAKSPTFRRLKRASDVTSADAHNRLKFRCLTASISPKGKLGLVHIPWYHRPLLWLGRGASLRLGPQVEARLFAVEPIFSPAEAVSSQAATEWAAAQLLASRPPLVAEVVASPGQGPEKDEAFICRLSYRPAWYRRRADFAVAAVKAGYFKVSEVDLPSGYDHLASASPDVAERGGESPRDKQQESWNQATTDLLRYVETLVEAQEAASCRGAGIWPSTAVSESWQQRLHRLLKRGGVS